MTCDEAYQKERLQWKATSEHAPRYPCLWELAAWLHVLTCLELCLSASSHLDSTWTLPALTLALILAYVAGLPIAAWHVWAWRILLEHFHQSVNCWGAACPTPTQGKAKNPDLVEAYTLIQPNWSIYNLGAESPVGIKDLHAWAHGRVHWGMKNRTGHKKS